MGGDAPSSLPSRIARSSRWLDALEPSAGVSPGRRAALLTAAALGVAVLGVVDYVTGIHVRVFPLYYVPISVAAWWSGRWAALGLAVLSTIAWSTSNYLAGQRSPAWVEVVNMLMQLGSFGLVAALIIRLRSAHARERTRGRTDVLTGLLNVRAFFDEAPRLLALARRTGVPLTVVYVDLDNFKRVNDSRGHAVGDEILRIAAHTLVSELRKEDFIARVGGDEFVVLLPQADAAAAQRVLARAHAQLESRLQQACPGTGASVGAVVFERPPSDIEALVRRADAVMYSVKASGRGRVVVVEDDGGDASGTGASADGSGSGLSLVRRRRRETSGRHVELVSARAASSSTPEAERPAQPSRSEATS